MDVILSGRFLTPRRRSAPASSPASWQKAWLEGGEGGRLRDRLEGPGRAALAKESVNRAHETTLETGLDYERKALYLAFASEDAREA